MTRQEANLKIITALTSLVKEHPDLRFGQILQNFDFVKPIDVDIMSKGEYDLTALYWEDEFYVEPEEILTRVNRTLEHARA